MTLFYALAAKASAMYITTSLATNSSSILFIELKNSQNAARLIKINNTIILLIISSRHRDTQSTSHTHAKRPPDRTCRMP